MIHHQRTETQQNYPKEIWESPLHSKRKGSNPTYNIQNRHEKKQKRKAGSLI
uniref:Uncharacterized protein n=1 Tax=Arundo donax TaxID=35708 RepID=A0A0A8YCP2_ARUDO